MNKQTILSTIPAILLRSAFTFMLIIVACNMQATIRYVKPTASGTGDGSSWTNASADLQGMINSSAAGDEVWVATGTYKPTAYPSGCSGCSTSRDYTFHVRDGLKLYGGFAGTETSLSERNIPANPTTLSGDFNVNDVVSGSGSTLSITGNTENAFHVVLVFAPSIGGIGVTIDGFTITGGNAYNIGFGTLTVNGNTILRGAGGGMYIAGGSNIISNNTLTGNTGGTGGGVYTSGGTNIIINNSFSGNPAVGQGGGIYTNDGTNTLSNNTFTGNTSAFSGGAIYMYLGTNTLSNNTFTGNTCGFDGGALYMYLGTNTLSNNTFTGNTCGFDGGALRILLGTNTLSYNTFTGNTADKGGGLSAYGTQTITHNTFTGNTAYNGGGLSASFGTQTITHNTFTGNTSRSYGGGISLEYGTSTLNNNTLLYNTAYRGGGIYIYNNTSTLNNNTLSYNTASYTGGGIDIENNNAELNRLYNNTLSHNTAMYQGGGISIFQYSGTNWLTNNIFWGNKKGTNAEVQGADYILYTDWSGLSSAITNFSHNLLQLASSNYTTTGSGEYDLGTGAVGNIFAQDPLFIDAANPAGPDGIHRTADDGLRLQAGSPAINASIASYGSPNVVPSTDILDITRPQGSGVDMGAYEAPCSTNPGITGTATGCDNVSLTATGGGSYVWSGGSTPNQAQNTFTVSNTYTVTVTDGIGCTATASQVVTVITSTTNSTTASTCDGYIWSANGQTYTTSGIYTHTVGCHTETLDLTITQSTSNSTTASVCDSYTWSANGQTYTASGNYTHTVGCHTETLDLTIIQSTSNNTTASTCDSYIWSANGQTYTTSGNYTHTVGCHTETLDLTITLSTANSTIASVCDSYIWANGQTYTTSGVYTHTEGCHTETLDLTITQSTSNSTTASVCDSYTWIVNGETYTESGNYTHTVGCHNEILNLTVTLSTSNSTTASACDSYTWSANGQTYTASGNYIHTVGCHTETLDLTITQSTSNSTTTSACDSYTWSANGQTYTASGNYTHTIGCHTETLNLTIIQSIGNSTTVSICDSYTWSANGQTYTASGIYTHTVGCHTETLDLTIIQSTSNNTTASACDSYTWSANGQTYTASGNYTHTLGCHTETLDLTITQSTSNSTAVSICDSYTWSVNGQSYTESGIYTYTVGCHTETLDLTIVESSIIPTIVCPDPIVVGNEPGQCSAVVSYEVSGSDNCSYTITQTAGLPSGSTFPVGVTTNTWMITNAANSTNTCSFTVTVEKTADTNLLWAYTVIGFKEVKMKKNTVQSGGVGVTNANKKVRLESNTAIIASNTFVRSPILELAVGSQVTTHSVGQVNAALLPTFLPPNASCGNNVDIPDNSSAVTLSLACYGNIKIGKNVTVTFSGHSNVNVKDLDLKEGATVLFAQNTTLRVNKKLDTGKFVTISRNGNNVWLHVDEQVKIDDGNNIAVNMHVRKNLIVEKTTEGAPTFMTGLFIAEKVDSKDNVFWNWNGAGCEEQNAQQRVQILDFNASAVEAEGMKKVVLDWTTNEDGDVSTYEVEKSLDGVFFTGVINTGSKNSGEEMAKYQAQDKDAETGIWLYRLKKIHTNGRISYSDQRVVKIEGTEKLFTIYPNPATHTFIVSLTGPANKGRIEIVDMSGRVVSETLVNEEQREYMLDVSILTSGTYTVRVSSDQSVRYLKLAVTK